MADKTDKEMLEDCHQRAADELGLPRDRIDFQGTVKADVMVTDAMELATPLAESQYDKTTQTTMAPNEFANMLNGYFESVNEASFNAHSVLDREDYLDFIRNSSKSLEDWGDYVKTLHVGDVFEEQGTMYTYTPDQRIEPASDYVQRLEKQLVKFMSYHTKNKKLEEEIDQLTKRLDCVILDTSLWDIIKIKWRKRNG